MNETAERHDAANRSNELRSHKDGRTQVDRLGRRSLDHRFPVAHVDAHCAYGPPISFQGLAVLGTGVLAVGLFARHSLGAALLQRELLGLRPCQRRLLSSVWVARSIKEDQPAPTPTARLIKIAAVSRINRSVSWNSSCTTSGLRGRAQADARSRSVRLMAGREIFSADLPQLVGPVTESGVSAIRDVIVCPTTGTGDVDEYWAHPPLGRVPLSSGRTEPPILSISGEGCGSIVSLMTTLRW